MNKLNKGKLIGVVAASLSAVSLMGVGFASWVISGGDKQATGDITVTVGEIVYKRAVFSILPAVGSDNAVKFDADSTKYSGGLITAGAGSVEDLTFNVTYTVKAYKSATNWSVSAKLIGTNYDEAVNAKYIEMPTTLSTAGATALSKPSQDSTTGDIKVTINSTKTEYTTYTVDQTFTFTWGKAFNNTNPCNVKEGNQIWTGTETEGATTNNLSTNLNGLKELNLTAFTVEFTTVVAA